MKITLQNINRKNYKLVPERVDCPTTYKAILIIPSGLKHDSGYMKQVIIGVKDKDELEICAYPDDVCWDFSEFSQKYNCSGMRTDCFYPRGVLHFWGNNILFEVQEAYSSTTIKALNKPQ